MTTAVAEQRPVSSPEPGHGGVRLDGLVKRYGDTLAVDNLSVEVGAGEFIALLGPSGCGKSTSLRILAGLEQADAGRVFLSGTDVTRVAAHRRDIHTVFQSYALFPHLDVADNVAFPLRQKGVRRTEVRQRVADALDLVHLGHAAGQAVTNMSGGQQQRVALARAIVDRPSVLLLDEPLSALDRSLRQAMQVELRLLQQELGVTTVLVTHDQEEALSLADRIVIMRNGQVEQIGTAEDVYDRPASLFVARFVGEQNELATDAGLALVRPEHVRVDAAGKEPPGPNAVDGVVRGVSLAGISSVVLVHAASQNLLARVPRDGRPLPRVGDAVRCTWDQANVRLFPTIEGEQ